ncbi:MAG: tripartite tricarboxylate transporter permease [Thermoplasmata archaeon]|nr:tripartite tricarboxylate transporter permease [Thermoplasmata archaeon]
MGTPEFLLAIILFTLLGSMAGIITGLVPGIHVNNVAYMILASQSALLSLAMLAFGWAQPSGSELVIIICSLVIGNAITHTFLDFIPSVFLGAPDAETALSLLPGHRMVLAGRGFEAVKCSIIGSFGAVIGALALLIPMRLIIGSPLNAYDAFAAWMHLLLMGVAVFLIMTERVRPGDWLVRPKHFEMKGHVLLGELSAEQVLHDGQKVLSLSEMDSSVKETIAVKAKVTNKFSDDGIRFLQLEDRGKTLLLELLGEPRLEPEPNEEIVAIGVINPIIGWKDHAVKRVLALGVFLLSGLLGIALLVMPGMASRNLFLINFQSIEQGTVLLFPLFTGLFGISTLLLSLKDNPQIPEQKTENVKVKLTLGQQTKAIGSGCIASTASWFPGISAAISTIISVFLTKSHDSETEGDTETQEFIVSVSAVNTSVALFNLMALFVILKSRSGAMKAVEGLISSELTAWEPLGNVPMAMSALLLSALVAAIVSVPLALFFGKLFAKHCSRINYTLLVKSVIILLLVMVLLFSGVLGLIILAVATCVGMIPPLIGVKRVHLMGCLIVPVIMFFI